jgi:hypothetical protein
MQTFIAITYFSQPDLQMFMLQAQRHMIKVEYFKCLIEYVHEYKLSSIEIRTLGCNMFPRG